MRESRRVGERMMRKIFLSILLAFIISGCMMGPDYRRPTVKSPDVWRFEEKKAREISNTVWWEQFNDPSLTNSSEWR